MPPPDSGATAVTPFVTAANTPAGESLPPDAELRRAMVEYQGGSLDAFHALYAALAPALSRYLRFLSRRADLAEDLLQETFLQMHRSRAGYDPERPVAPWAFGLARNVYLMNRRASARFAVVHDQVADLPDVAIPPEIDQWAARDTLRRLIERLNPEQGEPLLLHHVWGFSFDEIAGMIGVSAAAARARSSRAMTTLREQMRKGEEYP